MNLVLYRQMIRPNVGAASIPVYLELVDSNSNLAIYAVQGENRIRLTCWGDASTPGVRNHYQETIDKIIRNIALFNI